MNLFLFSLGRIKRGLKGISANLFDRIPQPKKNLTPLLIGQSREGRPLLCYRFGKGFLKILMVAGIHGNEVGTIKMAYHLINWLSQYHLRIPELTLCIIPCLNPDGFIRAKQSPRYFSDGDIGRTNAENVDLNRNFPTPSFQKESIWSFGKLYRDRRPVYCGKRANSEPETQALLNLILSEKIHVFFNFHNAGRDVMGNSHKLSQKLIKMYSEKTNFRIVSEEEWRSLGQTGTAKEWCEEQKIIYLESEGSSRWGSDWNIQKPAIEALLRYLNDNPEEISKLPGGNFGRFRQ